MIAAIVQARTGSTRLPGKVLLPVHGAPLLQRVLERVARSSVDKLVVATSTKSEDDAIEGLGKKMGVEVFRGDEIDVLDRYYQCSRALDADTIVRITGDCPLHCPEVIDLVLERFKEKNVDYVKTPANYPEGVDTEVCNFTALERSWKDARLPSEREHVTLHIRNNPSHFALDEEWVYGDFDHHTYHWSVDTEADLTFVSEVYAALYDQKPNFSLQDILDLLESRPELLEINKGGTGFEGLARSIAEDEVWKKQQGI